MTPISGGGFPIPIPPQILNFYKPTCQPGTGAFTQCTTDPGIVTPTFLDYNYKSPYMIQYNASVQQQLPWNVAVSVAYVGNHGVHLPMVRDGNPVLPTSFGPCGDPASLCVNGKVPFWDTNSPAYHNINPNYGSDINIATAADSRYNALEVQVEKRTSHGLQFSVAYTRSRVTDETQGQANIQDCSVSGGLLGVYPLNPQVDRGPACFNIPNNWEFNVLYHFPNLMRGNSFAAKALSGWFMSSIVSIQSGQPFTPIMDANRSNSGVAQAQQGEWVNINTPALLAAYPCTSQRDKARTPRGRQQSLVSIPLFPTILIRSSRAIPISGSTRLCSRFRRTLQLARGSTLNCLGHSRAAWHRRAQYPERPAGKELGLFAG